MFPWHGGIQVTKKVGNYCDCTIILQCQYLARNDCVMSTVRMSFTCDLKELQQMFLASMRFVLWFTKK